MKLLGTNLFSNDKAVIATSGFHADGLQMTKDLLANIKVLSCQHASLTLLLTSLVDVQKPT